MESEFLRLIQFDLYVNKNIFEKYKKYINKVNEMNKKAKNKKTDIIKL